MVSAYSIGTSQRSNFLSLPKQPNPGPGAYQQINKETRSKSPVFTIGNAVRNTKLTMHRDISPGPQRYKREETDNKIFSKAPCYKFGVKPKIKDSRYGIPGPGAYQTRENSQPHIQYSLGYRSQDIHNFLQININPGPGSYENTKQQVSNQFNKTNTVTSRDISYHRNTPGPGQYLHTEELSSTPKYQFGKTERFSRFGLSNLSPPMNGLANVGPGSYLYDKQQNCPKGPSISPKPRDSTGFKEGKDPPGPNAYDTVSASKFILKKAPAFIIKNPQQSQSPIRQQNQQISPAPNRYQINNGDWPQIKTYKFGNSQRYNLVNNPENPGPFQYNIPCKGVEGNKYTMPPRRNIGTMFEQYKQGIPGPDKYIINNSLTFSKSPIYKIGSSLRKLQYTQNDVPGPGTYTNSQEDLSTTSKTLGMVFGRDSREKQVNFFDEIPGPGQYNIKPTFADVPSYLLKKKKNLEESFN